MSKPFPAGLFLGASDLNDLVGILDRSTAEADAVSTTSMTVYSKVIPAGAMSSDRMLRLTVHADFLNNSGAPRDTSVAVQFNGTGVVGLGGSGIAASASRFPGSFIFEFGNRGATNSQMLTAYYATLGTFAMLQTVGTAAIDTTIAQTLTVLVTHSVSNASLSYRKRYALLELL